MTDRQRIERAIFNAQVASDGGKGIYDLCEGDKKAQKIAHCAKDYYYGFSADSWNSYRASYKAKESQIMLAIQLICRSHDRSIRFSVEETRSPGCFIVYFDFKIKGKREQISFHSFDERLKKYVQKSKKTTWSKDRTSRETARDLKRYGTSQR